MKINSPQMNEVADVKWQLLESILKILSLLALYQTGITIYCLFFHPLSKFPGPKLAATTTWYCTYFQYIKDGEMLQRVTKLHKKYGPVIRISPNKLHFRNSRAYHDIYSFGPDLLKDTNYYNYLSLGCGLFSLTNPAKHKNRWMMLNNFFSITNLEKLSFMIKPQIEKFCHLLEERAQKNQSIELAMGYRALLVDIVDHFIFGSVPVQYQALDDSSFQSPFLRSTCNIFDRSIWLERNVPIIRRICNFVPYVALNNLGSNYYYNIVEDMIREFHSRPVEYKQATLMSRIAGLDNFAQLCEVTESQLGGTIDGANILAFGTFYICNTVGIQDNLYKELKAIWPKTSESIPEMKILETLPWLTGCVKESARLTHGPLGGPPRLVVRDNVIIDGIPVPKNTTVTTSSMYVHLDPDVFPNPERFDPERWNMSNRKAMDNAIVAWSKGKRACPAKRFAYMELYFIFATIFRRFHVTPFETERDDFILKHYFSGHFKGKPLKVILKKRLD